MITKPLGKGQHPNSKLVTIRRVITQLERVQNQALDFMSMSIKSIGSYWASSTDRRVGTGLDINEIALLLPAVLGVSADDKTFHQEVKKFYDSMKTNVPFGDGVTLEIGLMLDNNEPLTYRDPKEPTLRNLPINSADYIRYRHALGHPNVVADEESAYGNPLAQFYIHDEDLVAKKDQAAMDIEQEAFGYSKEVESDEKRLNDFLILAGINPIEIPKLVDRRKRLRKMVEEDPQKVIKLYKTDHFQERVKVNAFLQVGIFKMVGNAVFQSSDNKKLAESIDELALKFTVDEMSEEVLIWSQQYDDITTKAKNAATGRRKLNPLV